MKIKRHNPYFTDKIKGIYLFFRWHFPYQIISIFIKDNLKRKHYIGIYNKYFIGWRLGRFMRSAIYKRRPCVRRLKYIGHKNFDLTDDEKQKFDNEETSFKMGAIYTSSSFNSATYAIEGYDNYIGCTYFDIV